MKNESNIVKELRNLGLDIIGEVPWGTHICQFYKTKEDLIDILVPYFKTGLENNEYCIWVTSEPLGKNEAETEMRKVVPHFDQNLKSGQMEIVSYKDWYVKDSAFNLWGVLNAWNDKLNQALTNGYDGIRATGNVAWLKKRDWKDFTEYEEVVNRITNEYKLIAICSYSLDKCDATDIIDIVSNHQFVLSRRDGVWEIIENLPHKIKSCSSKNFCETP